MSKITELLKGLAKTSKQGGICSGEKYAEKLLEKIKYVENNQFRDESLWLNQWEERLLGLSLSTPKVESYNTSEATHTCADFLNGNLSENSVFGVDITQVFIYTCKSGPSEGRERADIVVIDKTGRMRVKVWSESFEQNKSILVEGNSIILRAKMGYGKYQDSCIAINIKQAV